MQVAPLQRSETWILLIGVVLEALVKTDVITGTTAATINALVAGAVPVLFQTIFRKARAGKIPFVHA